MMDPTGEVGFFCNSSNMILFNIVDLFSGLSPQTSVTTPNPNTEKQTEVTSVSTTPVPLTTPPEISFTLEHKEYSKKLYSDQSGVIEQFRTEPKRSGIKYELVYETSEQNLGTIFDLDAETGVLRIKSTINAGKYPFSVKATSTKDSTKTSTAKVIINVLGAAVSNDNDKPKFLDAFMKKHVSESKVEVLLPEHPQTKCEYSLMNQKPGGDFFILNSVTGKLETNDKIDREAEMFQNQAQPHINIEVFIKCSSSVRKRRSVQDTRDLEHELERYQSSGMISLSQYKNPLEQFQARLVSNILGSRVDGSSVPEDKSTSSPSTPISEQKETSTKSPEPKEQHCYDVTKETTPCDSIIDDKIMYNTQVMKLLILIDDVNDNAPEFTEKEYFFGYPDKRLFNEIVPDNVGIVHATDKDAGVNAAVKYSIKDEQEVIIDHCTGTIFPHYAHFKYEKMTFQVTATDKDGKSDGLSKSVSVTLDILQGYHIMKMLVKRPLEQSNKDIITKMEDIFKFSVKVMKIDTAPSLEEISGSIELKTDGYDILEYYVIYAHKGQTFEDMNNVVREMKKNKELMDRILWTSVLAGSPFHYVQSKGLFSGFVVVMLILCIGSIAFYMTYIRTGKYYQCFNYFKKTDSTTPLERDEGSIGTSDYVVSFARMNHVNPTFDVMETENSKDFVPVTLRSFDTPSTQIINVDELAPAPPILVNSNSNSRRNSLGGEDNLGLSVGNDTRARRKSSVSFNEIVEQYHTVP